MQPAKGGGWEVLFSAASRPVFLFGLDSTTTHDKEERCGLNEKINKSKRRTNAILKSEDASGPVTTPAHRRPPAALHAARTPPATRIKTGN